jgi:hypothetical protein
MIVIEPVVPSVALKERAPRGALASAGAGSADDIFEYPWPCRRSVGVDRAREASASRTTLNAVGS